MLAIKSDVLTKVFLGLAAEIILNFVGLDNLADYSEFIFEKPSFTLSSGCNNATLIIS